MLSGHFLSGALVVYRFRFTVLGLGSSLTCVESGKPSESTASDPVEPLTVEAAGSRDWGLTGGDQEEERSLLELRVEDLGQIAIVTKAYALTFDVTASNSDLRKGAT